MSNPICHECERVFAEGEVVWVADWKVLVVEGAEATWKNTLRYTCDDCTRT